MKQFAITVISVLSLGITAHATDRVWHEPITNATVRQTTSVTVLVGCQSQGLLQNDFNILLDQKAIGGEDGKQNFIARYEGAGRYSIRVAATDDIPSLEIPLVVITQQAVDAACKVEESDSVAMNIAINPGTRLDYSYSERSCVQEPVDAYILGYALAYKNAQCTPVAHGYLSQGGSRIRVRTLE